MAGNWCWLLLQRGFSDLTLKCIDKFTARKYFIQHLKVGHTSEFPSGIYWWTLKNPKSQNFEKIKKKILEISFHTCVPKTTIIWGTVPEIRSETELFAILGHFLPFYTPSLTSQKTKIFKKWKKHLEMSSF